MHALDLADVLGVIMSDPVWARLTALGLVDVPPPAHLMREALAVCLGGS